MVAVAPVGASSSPNVKECIVTLCYNMVEKGKPSGFPFFYFKWSL